MKPFRAITGPACLAGLLLSSAAAAADFEHSWLEAKFTPCEGVGVHGSFRVHVSGTAAGAAGGQTVVSALRVHATSGAFTQNAGSTSAVAFVKVGSAEKSKISLTRPAGSSVEAAPKADETRKVYLPAGAALTVPKNGELWVQASVIVKTSSGTCALGSSTDKVPLP